MLRRMGLGTGVVLVLVGLLLTTGVIDLPGLLGDRAFDLGVVIAGSALALLGVATHLMRDRRIRPRAAATGKQRPR